MSTVPMVFCEMMGAQADINTNKHAMETILLTIIDLAFLTGLVVRFRCYGIARFFIDENDLFEMWLDYKKKYSARQ